MVKFVNKLFIYFLSITIILSCSDEKNQTETLLNQEFQPVSSKIEIIKDEIKQSIILGSADHRSKNFAKSYLVELKNILTYLSSYPNDKAQVYRALQISKKFEELGLPLSDQARISPLIMQYNQVVANHAKSLNIDISQFNWSIYSYDFNNGLADFWSLASKSLWSTGEGNAVNNQTKVTVKANRNNLNKSWLVTPKLDFTNIKNPEVVIRHFIQIGKGDGPIDTAKVLKQGYKLLVTDQYKFGDDLEHPKVECVSKPPNFNEICTNTSIWQEFQFDKPKADDFHTITTRPVRLNQFAGKKNVFVALMLNLDSKATKDIGKHFNTWNVFEFKILGSGLFPKPVPHPKALFSYDFTDVDLVPFEFYKTDPNGNDWRHGVHNSVSYATATSYKGPKTDYKTSIIYPELKLEANSDQLFIHLEQTVRPFVDSYDFWQRLTLKVSSDYISGQEPSNATWIDFSVKGPGRIEYKRYNDIITQNINLSELLGETISLQFEFSNQVGDNHQWQINNFSLTPSRKAVVR